MIRGEKDPPLFCRETDRGDGTFEGIDQEFGYRILDLSLDRSSEISCAVGDRVGFLRQSVDHGIIPVKDDLPLCERLPEVTQHDGRDPAEVLFGEIAKQIQDEMVYPGQVKITVIRETRSVAIAK